MIELHFSIMNITPPAYQAIRLALDEFERQHNLKVTLQSLFWDTGWSELVKIALYKAGPDVSEVGTTWLDGFVSSNAVRRFEQPEIDALGGPAVFLPSLWPQNITSNDPAVWGIPWLSDTRVVYYRRDLLRQAGIDEASAFTSLDSFNRTLDRLQKSGVAIPLSIPTVHQHTTMQILALWVWGAGGHFISPNGKQVLFHTAAARRGMDAYFKLRNYLVPAAYHLDDGAASRLFRLNSAAVTITGIWLWHQLHNLTVTPAAIENVRVALVPGVPFVGGSNLVIWKHTRHPEAAVALVRFLTSPEIQTDILGKNSLLPARLDALDLPPFTTEPPYQIMSQSLRTGRSFSAARMWGLIEDKLTLAVSQIWAELLENPALPVEEIVSKYIEPLARELNRLLAA
jgi:multiple sugar transport system substrate-binding protein